MNNALLNGEIRIAKNKVVSAVIQGRLSLGSPVEKTQLELIASVDGVVLDTAISSLSKSGILRVHPKLSRTGWGVGLIHSEQAKAAANLRVRVEEAVVPDLIQKPSTKREEQVEQFKKAQNELRETGKNVLDFWRADSVIHELYGSGLDVYDDIIDTSNVIRVFRAQHPELPFDRERILDRHMRVIEGFTNRDEKSLRAAVLINPY